MSMETKFRAFHKVRNEMYNVHGWHSEFVFKDTLDGIGNDGNPDKLVDVELMRSTVFQDQTEKIIFFDDLITVCVFFVSPENCDDDKHFKGIVVEENGNTCLQILEYDYGDGWKKLSETTVGFPFDKDWIDEDDKTMTVPLFELCAMSGNLGEYCSDNVEIIGNIHQNKY